VGRLNRRRKTVFCCDAGLGVIPRKRIALGGLQAIRRDVTQPAVRDAGERGDGVGKGHDQHGDDEEDLGVRLAPREGPEDTDGGGIRDPAPTGPRPAGEPADEAGRPDPEPPAVLPAGAPPPGPGGVVGREGISDPPPRPRPRGRRPLPGRRNAETPAPRGT